MTRTCFQSEHQCWDDVIPEFNIRTHSKCDIYESYISETDVWSRLEGLDESNSLGLDSVHPTILKRCAAAFATLVSLILRKSLTTSNVPDFWRRWNITLIFKKGSKRKAFNHRPVSLSSEICKVLEVMIHCKINKYCHEKNLITKDKHDFVSKKECTTNLF